MEDHLEGDKDRDVCILRSLTSKNFKAKEISQWKICQELKLHPYMDCRTWGPIPEHAPKEEELYVGSKFFISMWR